MMAIKQTLFASIMLFALIVEGTQAQESGCDTPITDKILDKRFIINDDQTVTDEQTKLIWKRCIEGRTGNNCEVELSPLPKVFLNVTWDVAMFWAKHEDFAGQTDWRLPNIKELSSIVDHGCRSRINPKIFPFMGDVWSSSVLGDGNSNDVWYRASTGDVLRAARTGRNRVRLVRDAE